MNRKRVTPENMATIVDHVRKFLSKGWEPNEEIIVAVRKITGSKIKTVLMNLNKVPSELVSVSPILKLKAIPPRADLGAMSGSYPYSLQILIGDFVSITAHEVIISGLRQGGEEYCNFVITRNLKKET